MSESNIGVLPCSPEYSFCGSFPAEIRNQIYSYLFTGDFREILTFRGLDTNVNGTPNKAPASSLHPSLSPSPRLNFLRTSRQIFAEAVPVLYRHNNFHLVCMPGPVYTPQAVSNEAVELIQHVHITVDPKTLISELLSQSPLHENEKPPHLIGRLVTSKVPRESCYIVLQVQAIKDMGLAVESRDAFESLACFDTLRIDIVWPTDMTRKVSLRFYGYVLREILGPSQITTMEGRGSLVFRPRDHVRTQNANVNNQRREETC